MIKATELRLGNLIERKIGNDWVIVETDIIALEDISALPEDGDYRGVSVSDLNLFSVGFKKSSIPENDNVYTIQMGVDAEGNPFIFSVHATGNGYGNSYWIKVGGMFIEVKHIHQIQNIVFSITRKELPIQ